MVELRGYAGLDLGEVFNHAVGVEFLGFACYGDNPVMAVEVGTLAWVGEFQRV